MIPGIWAIVRTIRTSRANALPRDASSYVSERALRGAQA
jgi:hypothetical protein